MKSNTIHVERELYLAAPEGIAVYAQNPSYVSVEGVSLVESVKHEALHFDEHGHKVYYHPKIWRRFSHDNGKTWIDGPAQAEEHAERLDARQRNVSLHGLDRRRNVLVSLFGTYDVDAEQEMFALGNKRKRTYMLWYELSFDGGKSWTAVKQVVANGLGYDETHWGPGLTYGICGASTDISAPVWLDDGSILFGLTLTCVPLPGDSGKTGWGVIYLRGRWNSASTDMTWTFGAPIVLSPDQSPVGCCEPAPAALGGEQLFNVMRCQGDEKLGIPSTRYSTYSTNGGTTWTKPEPLRYEDGSTVWSPASLSSFFHSSRTGRWYWIANILPGPVYAQMPRYPLCLAEFDPERRCLLKNSVQVIQDRPVDMPEQVRYTNWGFYEERGSGDLIMTLPEQPKLMDFTAMTRSEDFTADCLRYRIRLNGLHAGCTGE